MIEPRQRLVLPLDVPDLDAARRLVALLVGEVGVFKVGLELFTAVGPEAVRVVHDAGAACFLDLKLHDIPNTMAGAVAAATQLGISYLTIHTSSGPAALEASVRAAEGTGTVLLGVTVLTSLADDDLEAIGVAGPTSSAVLGRARLARDAGLGGLVASPHECAILREALDEDMVLVVPGIRPAGSGAGDQRRTATPAEAVRAGADLLVVGRPIRNAPDPIEAARAVVHEIADAAAR